MKLDFFLYIHQGVYSLHFVIETSCHSFFGLEKGTQIGNVHQKIPNCTLDSQDSLSIKIHVLYNIALMVVGSYHEAVVLAVYGYILLTVLEDFYLLTKSTKTFDFGSSFLMLYVERVCSS